VKEENSEIKVKNKNDLPERTFRFALEIVKFCRKFEKTSFINQILIKQLMRSGTSVGANVQEGQGSQSRADFLHKYSVACKEARETWYWLKIISGAEITTPESIMPLIQESNELVAILTTIVKKLKQQNSNF
jgi:four helix bundle protein